MNKYNLDTTKKPSERAMRAAERAIKELDLRQEGAAYTFEPEAKDIALVIDKEMGVEELRLALSNLKRDCLASDFNEHWESYKQAEKALREAGEAI